MRGGERVSTTLGIGGFRGTVVADIALFNYLVLIDQIALLPALYGRIIIPLAVLLQNYAILIPHCWCVPGPPAPPPGSTSGK
jgi:hypothetical protein